MDREVIGTGLAYGRRHDLDDPESERDFRDFVKHCGEAPVIRTIQDKPSRKLQILRPDHDMHLGRLACWTGLGCSPVDATLGVPNLRHTRNRSAQTRSPGTPQ